MFVLFWLKPWNIFEITLTAQIEHKQAQKGKYFEMFVRTDTKWNLLETCVLMRQHYSVLLMSILKLKRHKLLKGYESVTFL